MLAFVIFCLLIEILLLFMYLYLFFKYIFIIRGEIQMNNFKPVKQEKDVISIRIDSKLLEKVDLIAGSTDISRNELIVQCIEYAINNMN